MGCEIRVDDEDLKDVSADVISRVCFGSSFFKGKEIISMINDLHVSLTLNTFTSSIHAKERETECVEAHKKDLLQLRSCDGNLWDKNLVASDGLWDVFSNEEAVAVVKEVEDPEESTKKLTANIKASGISSTHSSSSQKENQGETSVRTDSDHSTQQFGPDR
ncbi:unnamed protein product [Brassica oleracea]|uniref:(rape) hypothetical protein n=1 Tax=Brassica napus TaxID=3708 RepID=A0A816KN83_BRANA|nr:unnamed protein product [Brassica napus]